MGFWANLDRAETQRANEIKRGIEAAQSSGRLPRSWFDAICRYEADIDEAMFAVNADREEAEIRAKHGIK